MLRADRRVPRPAGRSVCGGLAAAAPGQAGRLRPSSARARGAQGENLRGHKHGPVTRWVGRLSFCWCYCCCCCTLLWPTGCSALWTSQTVVPAVKARNLPGYFTAWICSTHVGFKQRSLLSTPTLNELSDPAVYSHSLTQSTKPTAAQILQTHLRKSIDARDASRFSLRQRKVTSEETRWR